MPDIDTQNREVKDTMKKAARTAKVEGEKFEAQAAQVPEYFREFAEKGATQAKETYEKMKAAAEEATDVLEDTYANAARGAAPPRPTPTWTPAGGKWRPPRPCSGWSAFPP